MRSSLHPLALALLACGGPALAQSPAQADTPTAPGALPAVEVKASIDAESLPPEAPGGHAAQGARLGILGNTRILDAPISVNAYTRRLIEDQQALTLADVLQSDPAVRFTTNSGHMLENFTIRGLTVSAMDVATNGLFGVAPASHVPAEMLERVEVLRGPSALLSGMSPSSSVGGTINLVTKRAGPRPITEITTSYGSHSYGQLSADVGRRFGPEQRLGVRVNGAYGSGEAGAQDEKKERQLGALALDYQGDRARFWLDAYSSRESIENGSPGMFNFVRGIGYLLAPPRGDVNLFRNTHGVYQNNGLMARAELDFNDRWQGYIAVGGSQGQGNGLMFGTRSIVTRPDGSANGFIYNVDTRSVRTAVDTGVIGNFDTGPVRHRVQLAYNLVRFREGTSNTARTGFRQNMYFPVTPVFPVPPASQPYNVDDKLQSLVAVDTLRMLDDRLLVTLGLRLQKVEQRRAGYAQQRVSPSLGLVFKPWGEETSLFFNHMEGLQPGQTVGVGYANEGESFSPMRTRQLEAGVKIERGGLTHTFSAYQIERPTLVAQGKRLVDGGKQRVRGVEWNAFGTLTSTLSMLGGVTYSQARQLDTGLDTFGAPKWTANLGLDWRTPLPGLSLGGRVIYTGQQWSDSTNKVRVPSWHRFDVNARYETRIANTPVRFNAAIENLSNRRYWSGIFSDGFVMPAAPRTLRLAATVSF